MKTALRSILASFLAAMVFFSTMSFTVGMHFCGDMLVDVELYDQADSCGMETEIATPSDAGCELVKSDCCSSVDIVMEGQQDIKAGWDSLSLDQQNFLAAFTYSYWSILQPGSSETVGYPIYDPPFLIRDVQLFHQTFLI